MKFRLAVLLVLTMSAQLAGAGIPPSNSRPRLNLARRPCALDRPLKRIEPRRALESGPARELTVDADPIKGLREYGATVRKEYRAGANDLNERSDEEPITKVIYRGGDAGLKYLREIPDLEVLDASGSAITDKGMGNLAGLIRLRELDLGQTEITDKGIKHVAGLTRLRRLSLSYTGLTGGGMRSLASLAQLRKLDLDGTRVSDESLKHLANMRELQTLSLGRLGRDGLFVSEMHGDGFKYLKGATKLEVLDLTHTQIRDASFSHLRGIKSLRDLHLGAQNLGTEGLENLKALKQLRYLEGGVNIMQRDELLDASPMLEIYSP